MRRAILRPAQWILVPAGAALEPALRPDERLHVGLPEKDGRLGVPGEDGPLRDPGEKELDHGREALDVRLLVDDEVEDSVGDELHVGREKVVAAGAESVTAALLQRPAERKGAEAVDRDRAAETGRAGERRLDLLLLLPGVAREPHGGRRRCSVRARERSEQTLEAPAGRRARRRRREHDDLPPGDEPGELGTDPGARG